MARSCLTQIFNPADRYFVLYLPGDHLCGGCLSRQGTGAALLCKPVALCCALSPANCRPIVRYTDIAAQLENREMTLPGFSKGITRFVTGLGKKVLLANIAGQVATSLIGGDLSKASVLGAWLVSSLISFSVLYFDFSGLLRYGDLGFGHCLASLMLRILIILIFLNLSRNFGAAGISA